jgi:hypothetical protein
MLSVLIAGVRIVLRLSPLGKAGLLRRACTVNA